MAHHQQPFSSSLSRIFDQLAPAREVEELNKRRLQLLQKTLPSSMTIKV